MAVAVLVEGGVSVTPITDHYPVGRSIPARRGLRRRSAGSYTTRARPCGAVPFTRTSPARDNRPAPPAPCPASPEPWVSPARWTVPGRSGGSIRTDGAVAARVAVRRATSTEQRVEGSGVEVP